MENQISIARSSLSFAPRGNLGQDFIDGVARVKGAFLQQQLDHLKPSNTPDNSQHEFRRLNRVTLSIG
jgi:hypothetical protein